MDDSTLAIDSTASDPELIVYTRDNDGVEIAQLPLDAQEEMRRWIDALEPVLSGSRRGRLSRLDAAADIMRVSKETARRKYYLYKQIGWRALVNWSKAKKPSTGIPAETVQWLKGLCEKFGGNFSRAYDGALAKWKQCLRTGETIPGYDACPAPTSKGHPEGWSYANLQRIAGPSWVEKKLARIGRSAAKAGMPLIIRTRKGLHCGQIIQVDDLWHDAKTSMLGISKDPVRALELCCIDVASASKIAYGIKPRIRDEETGKRINLRDTDMRFFLAHIMTQIGYYPEGCQIVAEHGTASVMDAIEKFLYDQTDGAVTVKRGGIEDSPALLGAWRGNSHGNPRLKAALESSHNLSHNHLRYLPGQTGSNSRVDAPEELRGRDDAFKALVTAIDEAAVDHPPEHVAWLLDALKPPYIHFHVYQEIVHMVYRMIDQRTRHKLEGWEECGYMTSQYRASPTSMDWFDTSNLRKMLPEERAIVEATLGANPELHRYRKMSPFEVWQRRQPLKKLGEYTIPTLLGKDLAQEATVRKNGTIVIKDKDLGPTECVFIARARNPQGHWILLQDEETYNVYINPFDSSKLFVTDARYRYIGVCYQQVAVSQADVDAVVRAQGEAAHNESIRLAEYRLRHQPDADDAAAIRTQNAAALKKLTSGAPITAEEKSRAKAMKNFTAPDLLSGGEETETEEPSPAKEFAASKLL